MKNLSGNMNKVSAQAEGTLLNGAKSGAESSRKGGKSMYGRSKGKRILSLILAVILGIGGALSGMGDLLIKGSVDEAWAIEGQGRGTVDTFAELLPITEVHIDPSRMSNPEMIIKNNSFIREGDHLVCNDQMKSLTLHEYNGDVVTFTFEKAAILPDRTRKDVVLTIGNIKIQNGGANNGTGDAGIIEGTDLVGKPRIMIINGANKGKQMSLGINIDSSWPTTNSTYRNWRYGLTADIKVSVPGASGDIIYGVTGMTNQRYSGPPATANAFSRIPNAADNDYYNESMTVYDGSTTAPVYWPRDGYEANVSNPGDLRVIGKGAAGGIYDYSFLTGFITEGNANRGFTTTYRAAGGVYWGSGKWTSASINSGLMPPDAAYILDISSSPGGKVFINKDGTLGEELGQGLYSIPRGKDVIVKLKPDNAEYYPEVVYAGDYVSDGRTGTTVTPTRVVEGGQVYYTYTFSDILKDSELYVKWAPLPAEVKGTKVWDDESNKYQNRGDIKFNLVPDILPAQKINWNLDTDTVEWGTETGFTDANGNLIPAKVTDTSKDYYYDNATYRWKPYNYSVLGNNLESGVKEEPKVAEGGTPIQTDFLPKYDASGNVIDYSGITEDSMNGYDYSIYYNSVKETVSETNKEKENDVTVDENNKVTSVNTALYEYKITNTLKRKDYTVYKKWNDGGNESKRTPIGTFANNLKLYWESQTMTQAEYTGTAPTIEPVDLSTATPPTENTYQITWKDLPYHKNKEELTYTSKETTVPDGYSRNPDGNVSDGGTVTNTLLKDVKITKTWDDQSDKFQNRPAKSEMLNSFALYINEGCTTPATGVDPLTADDIEINGNTWTITWHDVPAYDSTGGVINYWAKEESAPLGYSIVQNNVVADKDNPGEIKNKMELKPITITKTWDDLKYLNARPSGTNSYERPTVTIDITGTINGGSTQVTEAARQVQLTDNNVVNNVTWRNTFDDFPIYYQKQEITYTLDETLPEGFTKDNESLDMTTTPNPTGGVTNKPKEKDELNKISINIKKTDALTNTGAGIAGAEFEIKDSTDALLATVTTGANGIATFEFDTEGTYTIKEKTAPIGYELNADTFTVLVNKELTSITKVDDTTTNPASKVWQWLYSLLFGSGSNMPATFDSTTNTLTVSNNPITAQLTATKTWDDNNNQDGMRLPAILTLQKKVGTGEWTDAIGQQAGQVDDSYTNPKTVVKRWDNLPAYENGQVVKYRVVESAVRNYTTTYEAGDNAYVNDGIGVDLLNPSDATGKTAANKSIDVKNYHEPEKTSITINKIWNDANYLNTATGIENKYQRPKPLSFSISGTIQDGTVPVTLPADKDTATINPTDPADDDQWTVTVTGLPAYESGERITYAASELSVDGFTSTATVPLKRDPATGTWAAEYTNTPKQEDVYNPTTITVRKIDGDPKGGGPLGGAVFTVTKPDGTTVTYTTPDATNTETGEVRGEVKITFTEPGDYTIEETTAPTGYIKSNATFTANVDKELKKIDIKEDKSLWQWFYDLFVKNNTAGQWNKDTKTLTVPNTPEKTTLFAEKRWDDNDNQDALRNRPLYFQLYEDGIPSTVNNNRKQLNDPALINTPDDNTAQTVNWANLPIYRNGQKITYSIIEYNAANADTPLPNYTVEYKNYDYAGDVSTGIKLDGTNTDTNRIIVKNIHEPETVTIKVIKDWDDTNPARRGEALVYLYRSVAGVTGETRLEVAQVTAATEDNGQVAQWIKLPVYSAGKKITYRVEETQVPGYEAPKYSVVYTKTGGTTGTGTNLFVAADLQRGGTTDPEATFTITNKAFVDVEVEKTWVGGAVSNVTYQLYRTTKTEAELQGDARLHEVESTFDNTQTVTTWTPDSDWEKVNGAIHTFTVDSFNTESTAKYKFTNLPKDDGQGHDYLYRVLETTQGGTRYEADQTGNLSITNTNKYASAGRVNINVVKELAGRNWTSSDNFYFKVVPISGKDITDNKDIPINEIPVPMDSNGDPATIADVTNQSTPVGNIGYAVPFEPILYTGDSETAGHTFEYYYEIYETDSDGNKIDVEGDPIDGITYDAYDKNGTYTEKGVHKLKVVVTDEGNGTITALPYWDGQTTLSAVPVYTNTYSAAVDVPAYIVKRIDGRDYTGSDSFNFEMINLSGSIMRVLEDDDATTTPDPQNALNLSVNEGKYVTATGTEYKQSGTTGDTKADKTISTWIKTSDLVLPESGKAKGTIVYELLENASNSTAEGDDLIFDAKRVYMKVDVEDNQDGTMNVVTNYYLDAACTIPAPTTKVLVDADGNVTNTGNTYVNAAFFENEKVSDITVKKQWVNENGETIEPTDNAVIRLNRYKVKDIENPGPLPTNPDEWEPVANHTFDRGDFYKATIAGKEYTQTEAYRALGNGAITAGQFANANWSFDAANIPSYTFENLPLHVKDANGEDWQYIYRVREATGSEAFTTQYKTDVGNTWVDSWTDIHNARDHVVTIKNTVVATNTANIAAVKQLIGREWLDKDASNEEVDRYTFTLEPIGIGTYYENDVTDTDGTVHKKGDLKNKNTEDVEDGYKYDGTNTIQRIVASDLTGTPNMPTSPVSTELDSTDNDKALATKTTKSTDGSNGIEEVVGVGERLARFGEITYTMDDLSYDPEDGHMQGDFFYLMKEDIPADATNASGEKYSEAQDKTGPWTYKGVTYDGTVHTVHVKVRENRTDTLVVHIAYDEKVPGDITSGTQFTPVYTNRYDADTTATVGVDKYIMGRNWVNDETFDFMMFPMSGAPFTDANASDFPDMATTDHSSRMTGLANEKAIHNHEGAHVKRMVVDASNEVQHMDMPAIKYVLSDLHRVTTTVDAPATGKPDERVFYSDETVVPVGMLYGQFIYALEETDEFQNEPDNVSYDPDTEYARITVIDKGDGTLDSYIEIFEDRYCTIPRYKVGTESTTKEAAKFTTFVNKYKRTLDVTKVWTGPATDDVTLKLQWTTTPDNKDSWQDTDGIDWLGKVNGTRIIPQGATGDKLTVHWVNLPAYAADTDNIDLNDKWVYYRVIEVPIDDVDTRYNNDKNNPIKVDDELSAYPEASYSADQIHTGPEKSGENYVAEDDRIKHIWVGNFPEDLEGDANVHVVKQLIGRGWTNSDSFTFQITPVESKIGNETAFTQVSDRALPMPKDATSGGETDTATATIQTTEVSVNEHNAAFDPITIKLSDLKIDPADNTAKGWFVYTVTEPKPTDATEVTDDNGTKYWVKNNIKYTTKTEKVMVYAQNNGNGKVSTTIQWWDADASDWRPIGDFVPVYTNEALVPTPIFGSKTWVGGEASEHVNADANGDDKLGIKLYRKTVADAEKALTEDDLGRTLKVVWNNASGDATFTIKAINPNQPDPSAADYLVDPVFDTVGPKGNDYIYRIAETSAPNDYAVSYATADTSDVDDNKITNTCVREDSIKVTKTWDDAQDAEGIRPAEVVVHLYKTDGSSQVSVGEEAKTLNEAGNWTATWSDLPVYDAAGEKVEYVVVEEAVAGYTTTYAPADAKVELDGETTAVVQEIEIKNSLTPATDTVKVTKIWNDNDNVDGNRPGSVEFELKKYVWDEGNGAYTTTATKVTTRPATQADVAADTSGNTKLGDPITVSNMKLTGRATNPETLIWNETTTATQATDNTWEGEWINLPLTENEKTIIYVVEEVMTDAFAAPGTEGKYSNEPVITGDQVNGYKVTNEYTPETTSASVIKVWKDNNNAFGNRPATLTMELWRGYKGANDQPVHEKVLTDINGYTIKHVMSEDDKTADNTWKLEYANLPKNIVVDVSGDKESRPYTYYWRETVPYGYLAAADPGADPTPGLPKDVPDGYTAIANGETVTNTQITGTLTVTKTWSDDNDQDGLREAAITAFKENLKLYADGQEVTVDTSSNPAGDAVTKAVTDATATEPLTVVYNNLPVMHGDGTGIIYSVDEGTIANYTLANGTVTEDDLEVEIGDTEATGLIELTNEHTSGTTEITVTKVWDEVDASKRPTIDQLKNALKLYADGEEKTGITPEISINNDGTWTIRYANLQAKKTAQVDDGQGGTIDQSIPIVYTIKEDKVNTAEGETVADGFKYYEDGASYDNSAAEDTSYVTYDDTQKEDTTQAYNGGTITNKQTYQDIAVRKVWNDKVYDVDTQSNIVNPGRPETISLTLTGDDDTVTGYTKTDSAVPSTSDDTFDYTFEMMPVYKADGTTFMTYELSETAIPGYDTKYETISGVQVVVNTYQVTKLEGTKVWVDDNKTHNNPSEVQLTVHYQKYDSDNQPLTGDGASGTVANPAIEWGTTDATKGNFTVFGLPVGDGNGNTYKYWVSEVPVDGYLAPMYSVETHSTTAEVGGEPVKTVDGITDGGTITNAITGTTRVTATKVWVDGDNQDGERAEVQFELRAPDATGTPVKVEKDADGNDLINPVTVATGTNHDESMTATWSNLPAYKDGAEIAYTVVELSTPEHYTVEVTGDKNSGFTITNSHEAFTRTITVTKEWNDADYFEADGVTPKTGYERPKDVSVNLFADGAAVGEARGLYEDNAWTTSWTVPINEDGEAIEYVVKEINVPSGYTYSGDVNVDDATNTNVVVDATTGNASVTVINTPSDEEILNQLDLIVYKADDQTEPLAGATFKLTDPDGTVVGNYTSDAAGKLTLPLTKTGNYKLKEISAPTGHSIDDTEYTINVDKKLNEIRLSTDKSAFQQVFDLIFGNDQPDNFNADAKTLSVVNKTNTHKVTVSKTFVDENGDPLPDWAIPTNFEIKAEYTGIEASGAATGQEAALKTTDDNVVHTADSGVYTWEITDVAYGTEVYLHESGYEDAIGYYYDDGDITITGASAPKIYTDDARFVMSDEDAEASFINEYIRKNIILFLSKVWEDANDADHMRPNSVDFKVIATTNSGDANIFEEDGTPTNTKTVTLNNEEGLWLESLRELPAYYEGERVIIEVTEPEVPEGYTAEEDVEELYEFSNDVDTYYVGKIINTHEAITDSLTVTKTWDDRDNAEGLRPDKITVHLYKEATVVLTPAEKSAAWNSVDMDSFFEGVDKNDETAMDAAMDDYFRAIAEAVQAALEAKIASTDTPVQVEVAAKEIANGDESTGVTWDKLPVYDAYGEKIKYIVVEESEYGYTTTYKVDGEEDYAADGNMIELDGADGVQTVDIKNTLIPATDKVVVTKLWDDEANVDGNRPESIEIKLYEYVWNADTEGGAKYEKNEDAVASITLDGTLEAEAAGTGIKTQEIAGNDDNVWVGEFTNLPMTKSGRTVLYGVEEVTDDDDIFAATSTQGKYSNMPYITGNQVDGFAVTNSYTRETVSAEITKVWDDNDNYDGMRPDTLSMELWRFYEGVDDELVYERVTADLDGNDIKTIMSYDDAVEGDDSTWAITIDNLPANVLVDTGTQTEPNYESRAYTYYWKETVPENYIASATGDEPTGDSDTAKTADAGETTQVVKAANGATITNEISTFIFDVNKLWVDGDNREGERMSGIYVYLEATTDDPESDEAEWTPIAYTSVPYNHGFDGFIGVSNWWSLETYESISDAYGVHLPAYKDGKLITYSLWEEDDLSDSGYTTTYEIGDRMSEAGYINFSYEDIHNNSHYIFAHITNRRDPDFSITKVWNDVENNTVRPSADEYKESLNLYYNVVEMDYDTGEYVITETKDVTSTYADKLTVIDNGDGTYTATWTGLPQYVNGVPDSIMEKHIAYHVVEDQVEGYLAPTYENEDNENTEIYEAEAIDKAYDYGVITNTLATETTSVKVTKVWDDDNNEAKLRPNSINVVLYADGKPVETKTITTPADEEYSASVTFTKLPRLRTGVENETIEYTVKEETVPEGYSVSITGTQNSGYTITNTHEQEMIPIHITKVWEDQDIIDTEGYERPEVQVKVTGTSDDGTEVYETIITLTGETSADVIAWIFDGKLPASKNGKQLFYVAKELVPDGYSIDASYSVHTFKPNVQVRIDNEPIMEEEENPLVLTVKKIDSESSETLEGAEFKLVDTYGNEDLYYTDEDGLAEIVLNQVGTYTLVETAPPENHKLGEVYSWTIRTDKELTSITKVTEGDESFWKKITGLFVDRTPDGFDADTNTLTVENPPVETKTIKYVDPENEDTSKQTVLEETIKYGEDEPGQPGDPTREGYKFTGWDRTVDPDTGDVIYTATWEKIPEVPEPEKVTITYVDPSRADDDQTIQSDTINRGEDEPGQPADPTRESYTFGGWQRTTDENGNVIYTANWIKDIELPDTPISISVIKKWDDNNNQDGKRGEVTIALLANGEAAVDADGSKVASIKLNEDNNFAGVFDNLPAKDEAGVAIEYTVKEENGPKGYTAVVTGDANGGFVVTNSYEPETIIISATKTWKDEPETVGDSLRTDVVLHLWGLDASGNILYDAGTKVIENGSEEAAVWTNVPKHVNGSDALNYRVIEEGVFGYTSSVSPKSIKADSIDAGEEVKFEVTNKYVGPSTTISVTKEWQDNDNVDGKRPDTVTYELWQKVGDSEPEKVDEQTVASSYNWTNLPVTAEVVTGTETKTVTEQVEEEKQKADEEGNLLYVNTEDSEDVITETEFEALDEEAKGGYDALMETVTTDKETEVEEDIVAEVAILYTVVEKKAENYDEPVVVAREPGVFKAINYRSQDTVDVTVTKAWSDSDDSDGVRPDHISVTLKGDGKDVATAVLTAESGWSYTFEDLPKNSDGNVKKAIEYTVAEGSVEGYEASYSGSGTELLITNTHDAAQSITLEVTKVWAGEDGDTSARKDVVLHLMKVVEGYGPIKVEGQDKTISKDATGEDLMVEWTGLTAKEGGKNVTYTVEEETMDGYTASRSDGKRDGNTISVTLTNTKNEVPVEPEPEKITITYIDPETGEKYVTETIERGNNEPAQPVDPTKDGYTFMGWDRVVDPKTGDVTYEARWEMVPEVPDPEKITVKYIDGDKTVSADIIDRGSDEPAQPQNPTKEGYEFGGWMRTVDPETGDVTYEANWIEKVTPTEPDKLTTYLDPWAEGQDMIIKSTADGSEAPEDPTHEGVDFVGWDKAVDAAGNTIYVAKYNEKPVEPETQKVVVTFIDPQAADGERVIKSELVEVGEDGKVDPSKITKPEENPTCENMQFVGWEENVDANGNIIYTAKYQNDCRNPEPKKEHWVTYVDPDGTTYLEKVTVAEGEDEPTAPEDPTKEGYYFDGWDKTEDEDGNVTYTAKWHEVPKPEDRWVMYIDPATGNVIREKTIWNEGAAEPPAPENPTREGFDFDGWEREVDEDGNVTYSAKWKPESAIEPDPQPDPEPTPDPTPTPNPQPTPNQPQVRPTTPTTPTTPTRPAAQVSPKTGDQANMGIWIGVLVIAVLVTLIAVLLRRRNNHKDQ